MGFVLRDLLTDVPPEWDAPFQCPTNKTPFATKAEAERALRKINPSQRRIMKSFRCSYCDRYHLGHRR